MQSQKLCYSDLHLHTNYSLCAPGTTFVKSFLPHCEQEGIRLLGFSNHIYPKETLEAFQMKASSGVEYALGIRKEIDELFGKSGVRMLIGGEVETIYGKEPGLKREEAKLLDYILLAPSHIFNFPSEYQHMDLSTPEKARDLLLEQFKRACLLEYDVPVGICHPLYPICCPWEQEVVDGITYDQLKECFLLAAKHNKSIEIHACLYRNGTRLDADGLSPSYMRILSVAKECGCKFHFGSDAHAPNEFVGVHSKLELAAQRLGITENDLWEIIK